MENPKNREEKALVFAPKHFVPWVLTPVTGEFGVMDKGGCRFIFSDQSPLLKGGGDVGGKYPGEWAFNFFARVFRGRDVFTSNEAYGFWCKANGRFMVAV